MSAIFCRAFCWKWAAFYENGIKLDTAIAENIMVKGDGESIKKLFYIFAENAVKYTPANGNISVKLYYEKRKAVFSIRNSGGGIPREKIPKLFDRFYRTDEARTQGTSTASGWGLPYQIHFGQHGRLY